MKIRFLPPLPRTAILAAAYLLCGIPLVQAGSNILVNGDLKDEKEGAPLGWVNGPATDKEEVPNATYSYGKDPADAKHRRTVSIDYKSGTTRAMWKHPVPKDDVPKKIKPGKKYEFSFWVRYELDQPAPKGNSPVTARCNVWGSDFEPIAAPLLTPTGAYDQAAAFNAQNPTGDTQAPQAPKYVQQDIPQKSDWIELKVVFQMPKETLPAPASAQVYVALSAPGRLWADNFKLVEVPDDTPVTVH